MTRKRQKQATATATSWKSRANIHFFMRFPWEGPRSPWRSFKKLGKWIFPLVSAQASKIDTWRKLARNLWILFMLVIFRFAMFLTFLASSVAALEMPSPLTELHLTLASCAASSASRKLKPALRHAWRNSYLEELWKRKQTTTWLRNIAQIPSFARPTENEVRRMNSRCNIFTALNRHVCIGPRFDHQMSISA